MKITFNKVSYFLLISLIFNFQSTAIANTQLNSIICKGVDSFPHLSLAYIFISHDGKIEKQNFILDIQNLISYYDDKDIFHNPNQVGVIVNLNSKVKVDFYIPTSEFSPPKETYKGQFLIIQEKFEDSRKEDVLCTFTNTAL